MSDDGQQAVTEQAPPSRLAAGRRVAAAATALTLGLVAAKGLVGWLRGSPALLADAVHSGADALAIFASYVGLRLADRQPTERFPFGLYKAETLASLVVSAIILLAGVDLLYESVSRLLRAEAVAAHGAEVLVVAAASSVLSFGIYVWEKRVGERLGSQSLLANADESRADILTSLAVLGGTAASALGVGRVELIVAAGISCLIVWLGLKNGRAALYSLLDASLDTALEKQAREVAAKVPGALAVEQVRLRRAGPFLFGMAHVEVERSTDVTRGHQVAHRVQAAVREALPQIEMLTVHIEPHQPERMTVLVPAEGEGLDAAVCEHFGRAPQFVAAGVAAGEVEWSETLANPFRDKPARAGLTVIKEVLDEHGVDAVVTVEMGEIAFHALRDRYIEVFATEGGSVRDALDGFAAGRLDRLAEPTHPSEAAAAPRPDAPSKG
ncbi:MAG: cation diffusion facilitator family transporter [Planctomycetota bacterium]